MQELDRLKAAIRFRKEQVVIHRREIMYHNSMIEIHQKLQRDSERRMKHFYKDSGMLPYDLMSDNDKAKIDRMPRSSKSCTYCGADNVREGKKHVCLTCLQDNSPAEKLPLNIT